MAPVARLVVAALLVGCAPTAPGPRGVPVAHARAPAAPLCFAIDELAVRIPARALTLEGTLTLPRARGPRPAVVLLHGSGPLGRDEPMPGQLGVQFGFTVPVFAELADRLGRAGFVVIRFDKRTCTRAQGCVNAYPDDAEVGFDDMRDDADAVIAWLRARPEVDRRALYLIGHSLGGDLVPELMTDHPEIRAGVLLAAPFRPIDQISTYQLVYAAQLLHGQHTHPLVIGVRLRELEEIADGTRRLRAGRYGAADLAGAPIDFWRAWMALDDALPPLVDRLDRPLLAISGAADANVPPSETALWRARLAAVRPNPGHRAIVLPCATHALNCLTIDRTGHAHYGRHVVPAVLDEVVAFLRAAGG